MEPFNLKLFALLNAPEDIGLGPLLIATVLAEYVIYLVPLLFAAGWLWGSDDARQRYLRAAVATGIALACNQFIRGIWFHPRPFMMGVGHTYLHHSAVASFPSDHTTLFLSCAFPLLASNASRRLGILLVLLGVIVGWSRVFLGVHFPLDIIGAAFTAILGFTAVTIFGRFLNERCYPPTRSFYRFVFSRAIKRGLINP